MFGFLCKNVNFIVRSRRIHGNPSILPSLRCISTNTNTEQDPSVVAYLINSFGLSPKSALSASKMVQFETLDKAISVVNALKEHGFSKDQISLIVEKNRRLFLRNPREDILPKIQVLLSKGFSTAEIAKLSSTTSVLLSSSLTDDILPAYDYLRNVFKSDVRTVAALRRCLFIPTLEDLELRINTLRDMGLPESRIEQLLRFWPTLVGLSVNKLKVIAEKAREMGFQPCDSRFGEALQALGGMSQSTWEKKSDLYKRWGWSEDEILIAFRKQPSYMRVSVEKIEVVMDLFINQLGWEPSTIAKHPFLVSRSLKMLIPRASVLQYLISKGKIERDFRFTTIFRLPEPLFLEKFINCYDKAPELLKVYQEKLALVELAGKRMIRTIT